MNKKKKQPAKKKSPNTERLVLTIGKEHLKALKKYASDNGMFRGGQPNISEAIRATSAITLGDSSLSESVVMGNPDRLAKS